MSNFENLNIRVDRSLGTPSERYIAIMQICLVAILKRLTLKAELHLEPAIGKSMPLLLQFFCFSFVLFYQTLVSIYSKKSPLIDGDQRWKYFKETQKMRLAFSFFKVYLFPFLILSMLANIQWLSSFLSFVALTCINHQNSEIQAFKVYTTFALLTDFITEETVLVSTITEDHACHQKVDAKTTPHQCHLCNFCNRLKVRTI